MPKMWEYRLNDKNRVPNRDAYLLTLKEGVKIG